jgi:8-oxo-dGTP pyrophosphatase MutT (NUDIX family)
MIDPEIHHGSFEHALPHPLDLPNFYNYPDRLWVSRDLRDWNADWPVGQPDYKPTTYTSPKIRAMPYPDADPEWRFEADHPFLKNYLGMGYVIGEDGPHNPAIGRTGLTGRGEWRRYGPNYATDLAWMRIVDDDPYLLVVVRADSAKPGLVGGRLERTDHYDGNTDHYSAFFNEATRVASSRIGILRELPEETGLALPSAATLKYEFHSHTGGHRTTDVAWAESTVWSQVERANDLPAPDNVDDEGVLAAFWLPVTQRLFQAGEQSIMHAAHGPFLGRVVRNSGLIVPRDWSGDQLDYIVGQLPPKAAELFLSHDSEPMLY